MKFFLTLPAHRIWCLLNPRYAKHTHTADSTAVIPAKSTQVIIAHRKYNSTARPTVRKCGIIKYAIPKYNSRRFLAAYLTIFYLKSRIILTIFIKNYMMDSSSYLFKILFIHKQATECRNEF